MAKDVVNSLENVDLKEAHNLLWNVVHWSLFWSNEASKLKLCSVVGKVFIVNGLKVIKCIVSHGAVSANAIDAPISVASTRVQAGGPIDWGWSEGLEGSGVDGVAIMQGHWQVWGWLREEQTAVLSDND